jgi:hypothetical protein
MRLGYQIRRPLIKRVGLHYTVFVAENRDGDPDNAVVRAVICEICRVEMWRGGLGDVYPFPALSSAGASLTPPCSVSTSRSSNRTCGSPASGSRRRLTLSPTEG